MAVASITSYGGNSLTSYGGLIMHEDWRGSWGVGVDERARPGTRPALGRGAIGARRITVEFTYTTLADADSLLAALAPEDEEPRLLVGLLTDGSTSVQRYAVIEGPHEPTTNDIGVNGFRVVFVSADPAWTAVTATDADLNSVPGNQSGATWSSVALPNAGGAVTWPLVTLDPTGQQAGSLLYRYRHEIAITNNTDFDMIGEAIELDLNDTTAWVSASNGAASDGSNVYVYRDGVQIPRELIGFNAVNSSMWVYVDHLGAGESMTLVVVYGGSGGPGMDRMTGEQRPAFSIEYVLAAVLGTSTASTIEFAGGTFGYNDEYDDGHLLMMDGAQAGSGRNISTNDADTVTLSSALPGAPGAGDIALVRKSRQVNLGGGAQRIVYNVLQVERNNLYRGLWYLNTGQNRPDDVRFDTPGAWEPFLFLDNTDEKNQSDYLRVNVGTVDSFAILDCDRCGQGVAVLQNEGAADGIKFSSIWPITEWRFDGALKNPNGMAHAFFGSRPNETRDWTEVRDVTTAADTLTTFSAVANSLDSGTHHLCAVILPADDERIGPEWARITGSRTAGGTSGTATFTDATIIDTYVNDQFVNGTIVIVSGAGSGQRRTITDFVASTGVFTVNSNWSVSLDDTSRYEVTNKTLVATLRTNAVWYLSFDLTDLVGETGITAQANNYPAAFVARIGGGATGTTYPYHRLEVGLNDRVLFLAAATYVLKLDCPNRRAWIEDGSGNELADVTPYVVAEYVASATDIRLADDWLPVAVGGETFYVQNSGLTTFDIDFDVSRRWLG
jgi:hypothetical protein